MTATILRLFQPPLKPLPDARHDAAYQTAVGTALRLGDRVREINRWREDYRLRTGRAA